MTRDHRGKSVALRTPRGVTWADGALYAWALATAAAFLARWLSPALDHRAIDAILAVQTFALVAYAAARPERQVRRLVRTRLARPQCPSCCYDLAGLVADSDACTVCPECGAAWRVPVGRRDEAV